MLQWRYWVQLIDPDSEYLNRSPLRQPKRRIRQSNRKDYSSPDDDHETHIDLVRCRLGVQWDSHREFVHLVLQCRDEDLRCRWKGYQETTWHLREKRRCRACIWDRGWIREGGYQSKITNLDKISSCRKGRITYWVGNTGEILFNNKSIWSARYQDSCVLSITSHTNYDLARSLL